jgi:TonB family protein
MHISSSDTRVVAASTVTAVAVALATVIVYEGHVKVTSGGQTINVAAGSAVEIKPGEPPRDRRDVAASPVAAAPVVAGSPGPNPGEVPAAAAPSAPRNVPSGILEAHRTKGNKIIMPGEIEKITIDASREARVVASVELCVDPAGKVSKVRLVRSSGYPGYDEKIVAEMKSWEYQPVEVDGKAVPVCSVVTFIYSQQ